MPNPKMAKESVVCVPDFNVKYRFLYIVLALLATAFTLHAYSPLLPEFAQNGLAIEFGLATFQIFFQALFLSRKSFKTLLNYAGNLMTVSLFGALLLLPMLLINQFIFIHEFVATTYFLLVATVMFLEHFRRIDLLELPKLLCFTWILYRVLFLLLIVTF